MPTTITRLAREVGLSRSALLYYDSIGLLRPSARSRAGYRLYTEEDRRRLLAICGYREAGVALERIAQLLDAAPDRAAHILEDRLRALNDEIAALREQQRVVVRLLEGRVTQPSARAMDKQGWVALLRAAGLDDAGMHRWHVEFERRSPEGHQDFLESLGIPPEDAARIRTWSREGATAS